MSIEEIFEQYYKNKFKPYIDVGVSEGVKCCKRKSLINNGGEVVFIFSGQVSHYEMVNDEFIDFHKNQKEIPYEQSNTNKLVQNHIDLTTEEMYEFIRTFKRIELLFFELYSSRKKSIKEFLT